MQLEVVENLQFFLQYHGRGYNKSDVDVMDLEDLNRHGRRLLRQLEQEKEAREEAARKMKAKAQSRLGRRR